MANVFLNGETRDIETAIMLEQAYVHDIGKAVAYTDGNRVFINTDENLDKILPAYDHNMLKWLLWHERFHNELRHHNRFYKYLEELDPYSTEAEFNLTKEEVNIIMDILVHDSLSKLFPEIVEQAQKNFAQMRNRNSLKYTFTTFTLEEMLEEYRKYKMHEGTGEGKGDGDGDSEEESKDTEEKESTEEEDKKKSGETKESTKKGHGEDKKTDKPHKSEGKAEDGAPERMADMPEPEHEKTDWSKLEEIDTKEFIDEYDSERLMRSIEKMKELKLKLGTLTQTLNGLVTTLRQRTYEKPSHIHAGEGVLLKGNKPGRVSLYLIFDASGSMSGELSTFKEIISKSIPQALETPTEWFAGSKSGITASVCTTRKNYYKGKFKDILNVYATGGYDDDGDRTIDLCYKAEQAGYTPIGVTDGGGRISWSEDKLKKLKKTILVGQNKRWLDEIKEINPNIITLDI